MKSSFLIIVALTVAAWSAPAQTDSFSLPTKNSSIFYQQVVTVDSVSKAELFDRGRQWAVDYFNNARAVLQIVDKEAGQITGKGTFLPVTT